MKNKLIQLQLSVQKSSLHRYGVFTHQKITAGDIIEECVALPSAKKDKQLVDYYFKVDNQLVILTGFGLLYNHSDTPNAGYVYVEEDDVFCFRAIKNIQPGEEIVIYYGDHWFKERPNIKKKNKLLWNCVPQKLAKIFLRASLVIISVYTCVGLIKYFS